MLFLGQNEDALRVLEALLEICPKEPPIHVLAGKIYKLQGRKELALKHFEAALELDPKDTSLVKSLIENLHGDNEIGSQKEF